LGLALQNVIVSRQESGTRQLGLENYTFLTPEFSTQRTNVYAVYKGQLGERFSNIVNSLLSEWRKAGYL